MPNANTYLPGVVTIAGYLLISNMTKATYMVVTIVDSNQNTYITGQLVYLSVPNSYGMYQANGLTGKILAINGLDFTLDINSTQFNPYITPSVTQERPASLAPAGSRNIEFSNSTNRLAFQSLNNTGN